jgi:hypothetical protein
MANPLQTWTKRRSELFEVYYDEWTEVTVLCWGIAKMHPKKKQSTHSTIAGGNDVEDDF